MTRNFESVLPDGYTQVYHLDAREKKTGIILTVVSCILMFLVLVPFLFSFRFTEINLDTVAWEMLVFSVSMILYMVLHELVHGAAYKLLTHEKLTFGLSWSCAFCGVPTIYTYRRTALIALVSPLIVFTVLLFPLTLWLHSVDMLAYGLSAFLFSMHLGGCIGDIYVTWLLLRRYRNPALLMMDTGPEQYFYLPSDQV